MVVSGFSQKAGEKNIGNKLYSHSQNKFGEIRELTVKWDFRTLLGEPVLNGSYKWVAGNNTPDDFLDYRDAIVLDLDIEFQRQIHFSGRYLYIKLAPLVPKSGEGYGFNVSGSPNWTDLFCDYNGNSLKLSERDAKDIWKWGFKITSAHLIREGGLDKDEPDKSSSSNNDFWNTPENTTTQNDLKQKEELERQKQLSQQTKNKYNALKKPFTLNVANRDTVSEASLQLLKAINHYFQNGSLLVSSVNNGKVISKANTVNSNLQLAEGWNTLRIAIKGDNFNLKDSVRVYYKKNERFGRMTDQQGNVYKTVKIGTQVWMAENLRYKVSSGCWAYENDENNARIYGFLYDWETAMSVCPAGWHLPSKAEWDSLIETIGGKEIAKTSLKSITGWNENGSNSSGFSALPGGFYTYYGRFQTLGSLGVWWSASTSANLAWMCSIEDKTLSIDTWNKDRRLSVRYVRDF